MYRFELKRDVSSFDWVVSLKMLKHELAFQLISNDRTHLIANPSEIHFS